MKAAEIKSLRQETTINYFDKYLLCLGREILISVIGLDWLSCVCFGGKQDKDLQSLKSAALLQQSR